MIPYSRQDITEDDINEIEKILRSDFLTQGPTVPKFEETVAEYCGAKYAVAMNSATSALHIACLALDLGPGDWVWTSPNTFVASANCALYCGAKVDFVDIDENTYNLSIEALSKKLATAKQQNKIPKIVIPVHLAGQPCDMIAIHKLSKEYGFKIIEDASHAIGASYNGIKVGSCNHSDITVFSFHPVKIITSGEGGMALSNDKEITEKLRRLRTHGITNDKKLMKPKPNNQIWNYQQIELGFNYRMTDIHAALGLSQMSRLNEIVKKRHEIAKRYNNELIDLPLKLPFQSPDTYSSYHLYPICIENIGDKNNQKRVYELLLKNGFKVNLHYITVYLHPYYQSLNFKSGYCPNAERYYESAISIPIFPSLTFEAQTKVIKTIKAGVS